MAKAPKEEFRGMGKVAFRAREEAITKMVKEGYTAAEIHRRYGKELKVGYVQFARYVRTIVKGKIAKKTTDVETVHFQPEEIKTENVKEEKKDAEKIRSKFEEDPEEGDFI